MATAQVEFEENMLSCECSICHENFVQPKILRCGHLLCRACLVDWLQSKPNAQCPLCRYDIIALPTRGTKTAQELADSLPTDLAMAAVVDCKAVLSGEHACCVHVDAVALVMCLQCGDMLCQSCADVHKKLSMSRNHVLKEMATLTPERLAASRPGLCLVHSDELCKLFCSNHNVPICQVCFASKHRTCTEVTDLKDKLEEARASLNDLDSQLNALESQFAERIVKWEDNLAQSEKVVKLTLVEVDLACNRLQCCIEACRKRLKGLVENAEKKVKTTVREMKTRLGYKRGKLSSHRQLIKRVQDTVPSSAIFEMTSILSTRVKYLILNTSVPKDSEAFVMPKLIIDGEMVNKFKQDIVSLGKLAVPNELPKEDSIAADSAHVPKSITFNNKHGKCIKLTNKQQSAEKFRDGEFGIVFSREPMNINRLYEVQVDKRDSPLSGLVQTGVTGGNPYSFIAVPQFSQQLPNSIIIGNTKIWQSGEIIQPRTVITRAAGRVVKSSFTGSFLANTKEKSRIGILVDSARRLHVYFDGTDQGVAALDVPMPCWAVFDLHGSCTKITSLPIRIIQ